MSNFKKTLRIIALSIFGFIGFIMVLSIIIAAFSDDSPKVNPVHVDGTSTVEASEDNEITSADVKNNSVNQMAIPGLMPVDVYLNFENKGFTKKYTLSEMGHSWKCTMSNGGIDYEVYVFSSDDHSVESVSATATLTPPKKPAAVLQFIQYASSIPYKDADQSKVVDWITNNFNKDQSNITIGSASFTIHAPSEYVRILKIRKAA